MCVYMCVCICTYLVGERSEGAKLILLLLGVSGHGEEGPSLQLFVVDLDVGDGGFEGT